MDAKGKVFKYGENVDTDVIIPPATNTSDPTTWLPTAWLT